MAMKEWALIALSVWKASSLSQLLLRVVHRGLETWLLSQLRPKVM